MSTFAYAALTTRREAATSQTPSGIKAYVDAMAALVPAEVLALHAIVVNATTTTITDLDSEKVTTTIQDIETLWWAFWGLVVLSAVFFIVPRFKKWVRWDYLRALIPAVAFVVWTMLQKTTAFDAVGGGLGEAPRTVIAVFVASIVGLVAGALALTAEKQDSGTESPAE